MRVCRRVSKVEDSIVRCSASTLNQRRLCDKQQLERWYKDTGDPQSILPKGCGAVLYLLYVKGAGPLTKAVFLGRTAGPVHPLSDLRLVGGIKMWLTGSLCFGKSWCALDKNWFSFKKSVLPFRT